MKDLIKSYGGPGAVPKKKKDADGIVEKLEKSVYISALLEAMRSDCQNDYQKMATLLQSESLVKTTRGFGSKPKKSE